MKKIFFAQIILIFSLIPIACNNDDEDDSFSDPAAKQKMRDFVIGISNYAKASNADFIIIPQNGVELVSNTGEEEGTPDSAYVSAIDGNGQEDLFYGYDNDNEPTSSGDNSYLRVFLDKSKSMGKTILITDYCSTHSKMDGSYSKNETAGYVSFAADQRELNDIPNYPSPIYGENNAVINKLSDIKNFLYLINPEKFSSKTDFINAVTSTNYDLIIMDLFFNDGVTEFTADEIDQLKVKANGGKRLVISYMSIGEAEDYRYYWISDWNSNLPSWIDSENPDWEGNFKVRYWEKEWQDIIFGNTDSYLYKIISAHFDGVYLDIIDAFEYYE
jgi:cysteinyl-tRNA synthetase, unknown class